MATRRKPIVAEYSRGGYQDDPPVYLDFLFFITVDDGKLNVRMSIDKFWEYEYGLRYE